MLRLLFLLAAVMLCVTPRAVAVVATADTTTTTTTTTTTWTEMYIPYDNTDETETTTIDPGEFGDHYPYTYDDPLRQHLHVFRYPSEEPTPVYFFAHSNGARAANFEPKQFAAAGYSVVSWESVSSISSERDTKTCLDDFEKVWAWFLTNAGSYGFDTGSVVVGGRSRGSVVSWSMAHSRRPGIRGIYMYNALPDSAWNTVGDGGGGGGVSVWEEAVTAESPPMVLAYGPECPKPIQKDCVTSPVPGDGHNPRHGQTIVDRYAALGIGSRIRLIDGLANRGLGPYEFFPRFAAALATSGSPEAGEEWFFVPATDGPASEPVSGPAASAPPSAPNDAAAAYPTSTPPPMLSPTTPTTTTTTTTATSRAMPRFHLATTMFLCHLLVVCLTVQHSF